MAAEDNSLTPSLEVVECSACPNLVECRSRIVNGVGPTDADIVLVGEAPGATEDERGEPFVGRSGQILDEALDQNGLSREDIRITNCVRCRPPDNRDPHKAELANCSGHLEEELRRIAPRVIVPLGRIPTAQLVGDVGKITESAGAVHDTEFGGAETQVVVSVHPAATLYNRSLRPKFDATFETVADLASDTRS